MSLNKSAVLSEPSLLALLCMEVDVSIDKTENNKPHQIAVQACSKTDTGKFCILFCHLLIFFKINFFEKFFQEYYQSVK